MTDVSTVQLGQFTDENAETISERLREAGIVHWVKRSGGFTRIVFAGDWGTRVFVDADRLAEAEEIARTIVEE